MIQKLFGYIILYILFLSTITVYAENVPVSYKGRFRPLEVYSKLYLYSLSNKTTLPKYDEKTLTPQEFIWKLHFLGAKQFADTPLFQIHYAELKNIISLDPHTSLFSYNTLFPKLQPASHLLRQLDKPIADEAATLLNRLNEFAMIRKGPSEQEIALKATLEAAREVGKSPSEIAQILEAEYPLLKRLQSSQSLLCMLPLKAYPGSWVSLKALACQIYDPAKNDLRPVSNFTPYPDDVFNNIQSLYLSLDRNILQNTPAWEDTHNLSRQLAIGYQTIEGTIYQRSYDKVLRYPTFFQLDSEAIYSGMPLMEGTIALYSLAAFLLLLSLSQNNKKTLPWAAALLASAFTLHTLILIMRCYILQRPPVSNMFETLIYVPWIAVAASLPFCWINKNSIVLLAASLASLACLLLLKLANLDASLENVQAVLDSQYWLIVHVLMVVGSYGVFILCGIFGHFYLCKACMHDKETDSMISLGKIILQSMYIGTALLIGGTILGGVWAAESWGRFWDWDPKESWAFISSCIYLLWIHAYQFHIIRYFGLAVGSIIGLLAISFTWYGVNYLLGTGMHSYGFGNGGAEYYYAFLLAEGLFLILASARMSLKKRLK